MFLTQILPVVCAHISKILCAKLNKSVVTREFIIGFATKPSVCVFWVYNCGLNTGLCICISLCQPARFEYYI